MPRPARPAARLSACALLCLAPRPALAHLGPVPDSALGATLAGTALPLAQIEVALPLILLGLALTGGPLPWLPLLAGLGIGLMTAGNLGETAPLLALTLGAALGAGLALRGTPQHPFQRQLLSVAIATAITAALFHGGGGDLPALVGGSALSLAAGLIAVQWGANQLLRLPGAWPGIALRIAASWGAAILILVLALRLSEA